MNSNKGFNRMMGIIFMTIFVGMFCCNVLLPDNEMSESENRMLQQAPKFTVANYLDGSFERSFENYTNDQFPMRTANIRIKAAVDVSAGQVYSNGVWLAKDGYLIEDATVPTLERIESTAQALADFKTKHKGMKMSFLLAPNAVSVYEDKLPLTVEAKDQNRYIDRMFTDTERAGYINIDVRETFEKNADMTQLYYYTDHHWTTDGAKLAFDEAAAKLGLSGVEFELLPASNRFVGTLASKSGFANGKADAIKLAVTKDRSKFKKSVIYYEDTKEKTSSYYKLENLKLKDAYTVFGGSNHPVYTIKTPTAENRRLLLVKDSYANSMIPFLMQYYREIVVVDPRYYYDNIEDLIEMESINEVMFLYNANTFFADDSLAMMLTS